MEYLLQAFDIQLPNTGKVGDLVVAAGQHLKDHFIPHARNNYHPHILGHRALALMSAALVVVKIFTLALLSFGPVAPAFSSAITVQNIISLTNQSRQDYSLAGLVENPVLDKAAQAKADDMLAKGYFAHTTPDGKTPWDFITAAGYNYLMAGENLAVNFTEAENVETAWMNSPGHKANILNKNFEDIGIGVSQGQFQGHEAIFVVQEFGLPAAQKVAINDTPTPVQVSAVPDPKPAAVPEKLTAPTVRGAEQPAAQKLVITDAGTQIQDGQVLVTAKVVGDPVKVTAYFGERAVLLAPKSDGSWQGTIGLSELAQGNLTVHVKAVDIKGQTTDLQLADFTNSTIDNFNVVQPAAQQPTLVSWLGKTFDPKTLEGQIYLFFVAAVLGCMVLAVGLKRHIQHLSLIANSSFAVILACLLFMAR